jgi:hypothetical protein
VKNIRYFVTGLLSALLLCVSGCGSGDATATESPQAVPTGTARVLFSDLDSGPNEGGQDGKGVFVSVWGKNFGSSRGASSYVSVGGGTVDNYVQWTDTKITFQLGANARTGDIVVNNGTGNSNGLPFTVRAGGIYFVSPTGTGNGDFASPMSPEAAWNAMAPGRTFYFRGGTYSQGYGSSFGRNFAIGVRHSGTDGNPVAFIGYPGETATLVAPSGQGRHNITLSWNDGPASNFTIANFTMRGETGNISHGGNTNAGAEVARSGASNIRIVGNTMSATYSGNTMTGMVTIGGVNVSMLGNVLQDTGTSPPINNNHAIYIQLGASNIDVGWNTLRNLRMGHTIQVHTDTAFRYDNVRIHDNDLSAANPQDSRGINMGNVLPGSYGSIYNNVLSNLGQNFSAIIFGMGSWDIYNNTLYNIQLGGTNGLISVWGPDSRARIRNNILYSDGVSAYITATSGGNLASQAVIENNLYFGKGKGPTQDARAVNANPMFVNAAARNFRLQAGSPAIDKGSSVVTSIVSHDVDGNSRTANGAVDIGAFEVTR